VAELGELGLVQFIDLNPDVSAFQRQFVSEVKRCEEMERILRYVETEIVREKIEVTEVREETIAAPAPREMVELESELTTTENNLREVNTNFVALRKNHLELTELKCMLSKTEMFLNESQLNIQDTSTGGDERTGLLEDGSEGDRLLDVEDQTYGSMKFNITAGVIERSRLLAFETMLWRVSKGNVFLKTHDIEEQMGDPKTGDKLYKAVFMVFFQGDALRSRVKKICEAFHAQVYPCPETATERREMMCGVDTRLADLVTVLSQTTDHRTRLLVAAATNLRSHYVKVRKMKAVYHVLNMFNQRDGGRVLIGEAWMPTSDGREIREAVNKGAQTAGATIPPTIDTVLTSEQHPTFNRTNKFTAGFQALIDAYGVNTYREVNPSVYTIATFPFLFAVMFGDAGHGLIMLSAALFMILREKKLEAQSDMSEIFKIFFGGRYIVFLMSIFSIYTGLIYNDVFSKSLNIFGSHWEIPLNFTLAPGDTINLGNSLMLDPKDSKVYLDSPYPMGVDPVWQSASNKIGFLNTYKMKISLIFGVIHMSFGVMLSLWNKISKRQYAHIFLEFLPQLIFLLFIFGYLVLMIFIKWIYYGANYEGPFSEHCAPNLLITFINMMLMKSADRDDKMDQCHVGDMMYDIYMYPGQEGLQKFLLFFGVIQVPIILFGKPLHKMYTRRQTRYSGLHNDELLSNNDQADDGFGEIMINQGIHTIEYVLGSVSHTASYLRLWALSLAHAQLSEVLWSMVLKIAFGFEDKTGAIAIYVIFAFWAVLTVAILCLMEGLSAFLHTLRLHWVEFQSKFYEGSGYLFLPFSFRVFLKDAAEDDKEAMKNVN